MSPTNQERPHVISNPSESYGERFQDHLLEQYKLYVDSAQRVSEKRISTGNYLLTVSSSLLTVFWIATTVHVAAAWLAIIPVVGFLVSLTWFSLVMSYKNLNTAKFKVIHELENYLPAAPFRYEWHSCEQGQGKAYRPLTHLERWIPLCFAVLFFVLSVYPVFSGPSQRKAEAEPVSITGTVDVNIKSPDLGLSPPPQKTVAPKQHTKASR